MRKARLLATLTALAVVVAGCGGTESLEVDGVWARTSPRMADAGAVYLQMTAADGDRLVGASVDASVAAMVQIHETVMAEMDDGSEGMGVMAMQEVGGIDLPAGVTVALEPGGFHIMLMNLGAPLEDGQTFDITLTFETAGDKTYEVEVRDDAP